MPGNAAHEAGEWGMLRKSPGSLAPGELKSEVWELTSVAPEWLSH